MQADGAQVVDESFWGSRSWHFQKVLLPRDLVESVSCVSRVELYYFQLGNLAVTNGNVFWTQSPSCWSCSARFSFGCIWHQCITRGCASRIFGYTRSISYDSTHGSKTVEFRSGRFSILPISRRQLVWCASRGCAVWPSDGNFVVSWDDGDENDTIKGVMQLRRCALFMGGYS